MRSENAVRSTQKKATVLHRLGGQHVYCRAADHSAVKSLSQRRLVNHTAAGGIYKESGILHHSELLTAEHLKRCVVERAVNADDITLTEQLLKGNEFSPRLVSYCSGIANNSHTEGICDLCHLLADTAVADNTESLTVKLVMCADKGREGLTALPSAA